MIEFQGQESEKRRETTDNVRIEKSRRSGLSQATRVRCRTKRTTYAGGTGGISRRRNRRWAW